MRHFDAQTNRRLGLLLTLAVFLSSAAPPRGSAARTLAPAPPAPAAAPAPAQASCPAGQASTYTVTQTTSSVTPDTDETVDTFTNCDDCTRQLTLPFPVKIYDQTFSTAHVSSNGNLQFLSRGAAFGNTGLPYAGFNTTVYAFWDDLRTDFTGGDILTDLTGDAPNRTFSIKWRARNTNGDGASFELQLLEGSTTFNLVYGESSGAFSGTIGVQRDTGSLFTQFAGPGANPPAPGTKLVFTLDACATPVPAPTPQSYLDTTFSGDGKATVNSRATRAMEFYADGKTVAVGSSATSQFLVTRLNANGGLDAGFGAGGSFADAFGLTGVATSVAIQPDGKVVVAGNSTNRRTRVVFRLNADGTLDTSFATGGVFTTPIDTHGTGTGRPPFETATVIQPDGRIVVAGIAIPSESNYVFSVLRLNTNGTPDTLFDTDGKAETDFATGFEQVNDAALQPDGKIVVVGTASADGGGLPLLAAARYNADGSPDPTFDGDGKTAFPMPACASNGVGSAEAVTIQPDGKILIAGGTLSGGDLVRLNADGSLDTSFGCGGGVKTEVCEAFVNLTDVHFRNGKIVATGTIGPRGIQECFSCADFQSLVVQYDAGGARDTSFGVNGIVTTDMNFGSNDFSQASAFLPDGKLLVAGSADGVLAVARYTGVGTPDPAAPAPPECPSCSSSKSCTSIVPTPTPSPTPTPTPSPTPSPTPTPTPSPTPATTIQFSSAAYQAAEGEAELLARSFNSGELDAAQVADAALAAAAGEGIALVEVTRAGDLSQPAEVDYGTHTGTASDRSDYTAAYGTLRFAAGEQSKSLVVLITDDTYQEAEETFTVALSNPVGAGLGPAPAATVSITSDDAETRQSPVKNESFDAAFFVRQHYADFLNRQPDAAGLAFWKGDIEGCEQRPAAERQNCREVKRVNVSAAFFLSIEFQETGYFVYRLHQAAHGTGARLRVPRFLHDAQEIRQGVVVDVGDWQQQLEANKRLFSERFVLRPSFLSAYPLSLTPQQFVDALSAHAGGALSQAERAALVEQLTAAGNTLQARARVLRAAAEDADFSRQQSNPAFVYMQYVGYLRRNPDDVGFGGLADPNFEGYNFWLNKLDEFDGNYIDAEMVKAFILSIEYHERFGP